MLADPGTASVIAPAMLATAPGPFGDSVTTLDGRGVGVQSVTNGIIDTTTAHGKLVFGMFALMAEYEAGLIRERTPGRPHRRPQPRPQRRLHTENDERPHR